MYHAAPGTSAGTQLSFFFLPRERERDLPSENVRHASQNKVCMLQRERGKSRTGQRTRCVRPYSLCDIVQLPFLSHRLVSSLAIINYNKTIINSNKTTNTFTHLSGSISFHWFKMFILGWHRYFHVFNPIQLRMSLIIRKPAFQKMVVP